MYYVVSTILTFVANEYFIGIDFKVVQLSAVLHHKLVVFIHAAY